MLRRRARYATTLVVWAIAVVAVRGQTPGGQTPATLSLADAMARAAEANPGLRAAQTARAVGVAGRDVARQRPNPEVGVEAARETPHWAFSGTVPLETAGKRQKRIEVATAAIETTDAETARVAADLRADVRRAYFVGVAAARRVTGAQEIETIAARARAAAQERFLAGAAPRLEALQAELALAQAQNDLATARGGVSAARAELNALLGYAADAAPLLADPLEAGPPPPDAAASAQAIAANAEIAVLEKRIAEERARVALAAAMRRPDPSLTGTLTYDAPGEFVFGWRAAAAVSLPIFTTGRPEVRLAEASLARAIAERDARASQISGTVNAALARAIAARQALDRSQRDILPVSLQVEGMAEESYRAGQTGLPAYLQTLQAAREVRQRAIEAGLDYQLALADLERAMGTPIR